MNARAGRLVFSMQKQGRNKKNNVVDSDEKGKDADYIMFLGYIQVISDEAHESYEGLT